MNKVVLILIAVVLVAIAGFATLWFGVGSRLQETAEGILADWNAGREAAIYEAASDELRAGRTLEQFKAYLDYWKTRRGAYQAVEERQGVSFSMGTSKGDSKTIKLGLRFERGTADARFVFRPAGDALQLLHFSLHEPPKPVAKDDTSGFEATAHALFMRYNEKDMVGLYAALSPELQMAWPPATIEEQVGTLHARGGKIDENFTQREMKAEDDGERRIVLYDITFERTPGTAKLGFQWADGHWHVVEFRLKFGRDP